MEEGRMATLQDPQGAMISLWQGRKTPGVGIIGDVGAQCWSELMTKDVGGARGFYTSLFGWVAEDMAMGPMTYTVFKKDGAPRAGLMAITPDMGPVPPHWLTYFAVADCDVTVAKALSLGARALAPTMQVPTVGRFAPLMDPQGAAFAVMGPEKK
jgi:predicted enzyme related to lactoylglutathione lyase